MKKIILASAILGVSVMTFGSISTLAATYSSATEAKGTGKIEFEDEESEIVDPIDPIKPIDPTDPDPNPNTGDLVLQYVPDFNFGKHKKNFNGLTAQALPVKIKEKDSQAAPYDSTLFVSTKDVRTDRGAGWDLVVTSTQFKDATNHVIEGGEVVLTNAAYNGTGDNYKPVPVLAATETELSKGLRLLPGQEVPVATADASKDQGIGSYSLALGELVDGRVTGVTFQMPARTAVNNGEYTASFDWELVAK